MKKVTRGLYFEDFNGDEILVTQARTITEADIVNFCGFTGDWSQLHSNSEYSKTTTFKQRIAHGMLTKSVGIGLAILTGILEETIIAFESIQEWFFKRPVFIGDTIHVEMQVINKEERQLRGGFKAGHVTIQAKIKKQGGKVCQEGKWAFLMKLKSEEES